MPILRFEGLVVPKMLVLRPLTDHTYHTPGFITGRPNVDNTELNEFVRRAETLYETRLRAVLEPDHRDEFVAIEPESGDYFLGRTLNDAARAARKAHPGRPTHAMRVGHAAALHLGKHFQ